MLLYAAKDQHFEQTTSNNKLRTEVFSQLFYSLFIFENSHNKASRLLFIIFFHISTVRVTRQCNTYFLGATKPSTVLFSFEMAENTARKAAIPWIVFADFYNWDKKLSSSDWVDYKDTVCQSEQTVSNMRYCHSKSFCFFST